MRPQEGALDTQRLTAAVSNKLDPPFIPRVRDSHHTPHRFDECTGTSKLSTTRRITSSVGMPVPVTRIAEPGGGASINNPR